MNIRSCAKLPGALLIHPHPSFNQPHAPKVIWLDSRPGDGLVPVDDGTPAGQDVGVAVRKVPNFAHPFQPNVAQERAVVNGAGDLGDVPLLVPGDLLLLRRGLRVLARGALACASLAACWPATGGCLPVAWSRGKYLGAWLAMRVVVAPFPEARTSQTLVSADPIRQF